MLYNICKNFLKNFKFYFKQSSIHGLSNILRSKTWPDTILWIAIFLLAIYYFLALLYTNLLGYSNQPLSRTIQTTAHPVSVVPFPAVTICNFNLVMKSRAEPIIQMLMNNNIKEKVARDFFKNLNLLKTPVMIDSSPYRQVYQALTENGYPSYRVMMRNISQTCNEMLNNCTFAGQKIDCSSIFTGSKSDFGYCCSFNSNLYPKDRNNYLNKEYYTSAGPLQGLAVALNISPEEYLSSAYNVTGMIVTVHDKNSYAEDSSFFAVVEAGKEISMKLKPRVYNAEENVKTVGIGSRKCVFPNEDRQYLNVTYTFANCMHVCKTYAIGNLCSCVPYYHTDYARWRTCTLLNVPCLKENEDKYTTLGVRLNKIKKWNTLICDCLPPCSGIEYSGTLEPLFFRNISGHKLTQYSGIRVYFQNNWCIKYAVNKSMRDDVLIALVGGLFALCLGGSILNIIETLYYLIKSIFVKYDDNQYQAELYWGELEVFKKMEIKNRNQIVILSQHYNNYLN